ncbi:DUF883 family protein [Tropicibacter sp. S64]|uniref:DUF883 family protein n=1 Tax=Tropicibacter sp. S64 TaxID=3415122 RepID=UPI003C7D942A
MTTVHPMEADTRITSESETESLADRARRSVHDARDKASQTAADLRERAEKAGHDLRDRADRASHDLRERAEFEYELGKERLGKAGSEAERLVKDNPALAIAGAVGVGVLLGLALGNSRRG